MHLAATMLKLIRHSLVLQFDTVMTSYKKHSRQWSTVYNKFAEGKQEVGRQVETFIESCVSIQCNHSLLAFSAYARPQESYGWLIVHIAGTSHCYMVRFCLAVYC